MPADAVDTKAVTDICQKAIRRVFTDWEEMVNADISLKGSKAQEATGQAGIPSPSERMNLFVETQVEGAHEDIMFFVFPIELGMRLIGSMIMLPEDVIQEKMAEPLSKNDLDAFKELANLMCGSSNNAFQSLGIPMRVSQSVNHLSVHSQAKGEAVPSSVPDSELLILDHQVQAKGEAYSLLQVLPKALGIAIEEQQGQ